MTKVQTIPVLDAIKEHADFHSSVFFSYGIDLAFFENAFLHPLWQNNCRNNLVYIDSERYADTISDWRGSTNWVGKRYLLTPIHLHGLSSFHSKIILLLGKDRARLLVGSGNLTFSGIGANNEVFTCLDWTEQDTNYLPIFQQVWLLVGRVQNLWGKSDQAIRMYQKAGHQSEWLEQLYETSGRSPDLQFFHNLDESLINQFDRALSGEKVQEITVVSPFLDNQAKALREIFIRFKPQKLRLVLQEQRSTGNLNALDELKNSGVPLDVHLFQDAERYLHAKIYIVKTDHYSYVLTGSANCTAAGLLAQSGQGNFETMLLARTNSDDYYLRLLRDRVDENPVLSLEQVKLGEQKTLSVGAGYSIELFSIQLSANVLTIGFSKDNDGNALLGLEVCTIPPIQLPLDHFPSGKHEHSITLSDQQLQLIQQEPLAAHIFQYDKNGVTSERLSNSIWIINTNDLNRARYTLAGINLRTGEYLRDGYLGSEEEWRDLYTSLSQLISLEISAIQKVPISSYKIQNEDASKQGDAEKSEKETEVTFPGDYDVDEQKIALEGDIFREGILYALLEYAHHTMPWRDRNAGQQGSSGGGKPRVRKQPSGNLGKKFTGLVTRYIKSLENTEYMQSVSVYQAVNYYTVFQRMAWLLYRHNVFDKNRFVEYSRQINMGLFDTRESGAPVLNPYSQKHVRRIWQQEWQEFGAAIHALVSCIVLNRCGDKDDSNSRTTAGKMHPMVLANIAVVANINELLNDVDRISALAEVYEFDDAELLGRLEQFVRTWREPAITILEKWLQGVILALNGSQDQQVTQRLLQARLDYGLALEQFYEQLRDEDARISLCSDIVFWAERAGDKQVVQEQRNKLIQLLRKRGNLNELARQLIDLGQDLRSKELYLDAIRQFQQALFLAEETDDQSLIRVCNVYLAAMKFYVK